jgi:hypothetical protein
MDQEVATATRGRVQLVLNKILKYGMTAFL